MFRNKKPVINIGRTNINGMTRGSRIFAGTMIFTLINQNWVNDLKEQLTWLSGFDELRADELPLFDIMVISANEYGNYVSMYIFGVDFTDEAQTISVEDLFTENVFQFVARDVSTFKAGKQIMQGKGSKDAHAVYGEYYSKLYVLSTTGSTEQQLSELNKKLSGGAAKIQEQSSKLYKVLGRDIYYSPAKLMSGDDVLELQKMMNKLGSTVKTTGIYDQDTRSKLMEIQSKLGLEPDGVVKTKDWNAMLDTIKEINEGTGFSDSKIYSGIIVNKNGAYVYKEKTLSSDIVETLPFKTFIDLYELSYGYGSSGSEKFYKTSNGWVVSSDIYSTYDENRLVEFPTLSMGNENHYVLIVQNMLKELYPSYSPNDGMYDSATYEYVKRFQKENDLDPDGIVDKQTWLVLNAKANGITSDMLEDSFTITHNWPQGEYNIKYYDSGSTLERRLETIKSFLYSEYPQNVKLTAIASYENNKTQEYSKTLSITDKELAVSPASFIDSLGYNPYMGGRPVSMEYIVYPYNKEPYKWFIKFS